MARSLYSPGQALADRHSQELRYLKRLRGMLRSKDLAAQPWHELGLNLQQARNAKQGPTKEELDAAVSALSNAVRTKATFDFNMSRLAEGPIEGEKRWVARRDGKTRHTHIELDGQVVPTLQPFSVDGMKILMPGDPGAPPALSFNCRCVLVFLKEQKTEQKNGLRASGTRQTFRFNPDQLRVPKGFGELSGRWMDMPLGSIKLFGKPGAKSEYHAFQKATPELKEQFKAKYGKAIPPSWTDVYVNLDDGAKVIVRGKDKAGRSQSVYSDAHTAAQARAKFEKTTQLMKSVNEIEHGLAKVDGDGTKAAARLMYLTGMRVGNPPDGKAKVDAYGATTLQRQHVTEMTDGSATLEFTAKEGIPAKYVVDDPEIVKFIHDTIKQSGNPEDKLFGTSSDKTQELLKNITGGHVLNKDMRTLVANRIASAEVTKWLKDSPLPKNEREFNRARMEIATIVSQTLRNKPKQAIDSYIDPALFEELRKELDQ